MQHATDIPVQFPREFYLTFTSQLKKAEEKDILPEIILTKVIFVS